MEIFLNIFFIILFLSILLFLERDNIKEIPFELYFIFGAGGYVISITIITLLKTF